jgi:hypothetical protein
MNLFRRKDKEPEVKAEVASLETSLVKHEIWSPDITAAVINNGEDHNLWERFADKEVWERNLWQLKPLITGHWAPDDIPS